MSTSIDTSIGLRAQGSETQITSPPPVQATHQDEPHKDSSASSGPIGFTSPVIKVDADTGLALIVVRDGSTGEQLDQYPSKKVVEEYQRHQIDTAEVTKPVNDQGKSLTEDVKAPPAPVALAAAAQATSPVEVGSSPQTAETVSAIAS
jgi:hypothetical protein